MGAVFLDQLGRTCEFLSSNPYLYSDLTHLNLTEGLAAMEALWGLTQPQPQPSLARTSVDQAPRRTDSRAGQALISG